MYWNDFRKGAVSVVRAVNKSWMSRTDVVYNGWYNSKEEKEDIF